MSTRPTRRPKYARGHLILPQQRDAIMIPVHMALAAFEHGHGNVDHYETLAAFSNLAGEMAQRMQTAPETRQAIAGGAVAIKSAGQRWMKLDRFGFAGPEMIEVRKLVTLGDELVKRANSAVLMAVMAAIEEYMRKTYEACNNT